MTLVILGTQDKTFERMLEGIEKQIKKGNLKDEVIVQAGSTKFESENMQIFDLIPMNKFNNLIKTADLIITHGGVGSILSGLRNNKKVIAIPRLAEYGEHENNHQLEIIEEFTKMGYILSCKEMKDLGKVLKKVNDFEPKKYKSNNNKMIKLIENYIDSL